MASTFDSLIKTVQQDLKTGTAVAVRKSVGTVISGKQVDPNVVGGVVDKVINNAMGSLLGAATKAVSSTISKAIGKYTKSSGLNMIAGNIGAQVLQSIITGKAGPTMSVQLTNTISKGITTELINRLPKSLTKTINPSILGAQFNLGIMGVVSKAVSGTVGAIVNTITNNAPPSDATKLSVPSLYSNEQPSTTGFNLSNLTTNLLSSGALSSLTSNTGLSSSSINMLVSSLGKNVSSMTSISLPQGLDISRLTSGSDSLGKVVQMASAPIGSLTKTAGVSGTDSKQLSSSLANATLNSQEATLGGKLDLSAVTSNSDRPIAKDLSSTLSNINSAFGVKSEEDKKVEKNIQDATDAVMKKQADSAKVAAKSFNTLSDDQLLKLTTTKQGFTDPTATYPTPEYQNRVETNRLATGDTKDTIVDKKRDDRMLGAQLPNGNSWEQPEIPYAAVYPYNQVTETRSGHVIEIDDTPGAERIHQYHKSGTFEEIDSVGNRVTKIVGSDYTIIDKNGYISIHGKANISVNGSCNVFINCGANIEVHGNTVLNGYSDVEVNAAGSLQLTGGESIHMKSPYIYMDADTELHVNADVAMKVHAKDFNLISDTDIKVEAGNDIKLTSDNDIHLKADDILTTSKNLHTTTTENILTKSGGKYDVSCTEVNFKSSGNFNLDSSEFHGNQGAASPTTPTVATIADAADTEYSNASCLDGREHVTEHHIEDVIPTNGKHKEIVGILETNLEKNNTTLTDETKANLIVDAGISPTELVAPITDSTPITPKPVADIIVPPVIPLGNVDFPDNFRLSEHFTIADLTTKTTVPSKLQYNGYDFTVDKIVANLQFMALNILEPMYAANPNLKIYRSFEANDENYSKFKSRNFGFSVTIDFDSIKQGYEFAKLMLPKIPYIQAIFSTLASKDIAMLIIVAPPVNAPTAGNDSIISSWAKYIQTPEVYTANNGVKVSDGLVMVM